MRPGVPLARLKARVVLKDQRFEFVAYAWFRGPTKLWAEWSPARTEAGS